VDHWGCRFDSAETGVIVPAAAPVLVVAALAVAAVVDLLDELAWWDEDPLDWNPDSVAKEVTALVAAAAEHFQEFAHVSHRDWHFDSIARMEAIVL
jgi:hypothetical protein